MRFLVAYVDYFSGIGERYERWIDRLKAKGNDIVGVCVTLNRPGPQLRFKEMENRWYRKDKELMRLYENIGQIASSCDVLINMTGANLHPDFVSQLPTINVLICNDDPESSSELSAPHAHVYDFCFTGNAACVQLYYSWGVRNVDFLPMGFYEDDYNPYLDENTILSAERRWDIGFVGERVDHWRKERIDRIVKAFPNGKYYGRGWPKGFLSKSKLLELYSNMKVGINIHNSVGPVNRRTYALPANGVMQICDNKCRLGQLFKLNEEVVGVDTIEEMIEAVQYYLHHEEERVNIAIAGWKRALKDYSEDALWRRLVTNISGIVKKEKVKSVSRAKSIDVSFLRPSAKKRFNYEIERMAKRLRNKMDKTLLQLGVEVTWKTIPLPCAGVNCIRNSDKKWGEIKPSNIADECKREEIFMESPGLVAQSHAVASLVGKEAKRIVNYGSGTGVFAFEAAADPSRIIWGFEPDEKSCTWARLHRSRPNIHYTSGDNCIINEKFELAVAINIIEKLDDHVKFLNMMAKIAQRALITTPNSTTMGQPCCGDDSLRYSATVGKWSAGEFYWVLRCWYRKVKLFTMANPFVPSLEEIDLHSSQSPLIADCREPVG